MGQIGTSVNPNFLRNNIYALSPTGTPNYSAKTAPAATAPVSTVNNPANVTQPTNTNTQTQVAPNSAYPTNAQGGILPATVEPFNPIQEKGFQMALDQNTKNPYSDYISSMLQQLLPQAQGMYGQAADFAKQGAGVTFDPSMATPYLNKYVEQYIDPTVARMRREHDITQSGIKAEASRVGAFGDSGYGVRSSQNDEALNRNVGDFTGQAYYNSYTNALQDAMKAAEMKASNLFNGASSLSGTAGNMMSSSLGGLSALGNLGTNDLTQYRTAMSDIVGAGDRVQQQNQNVLNALEGSRQGASNYDWSQIQQLLSILSAYKSGTGVTIPGMNTGEQIGTGIAMAGPSIKNLYNQWSTNSAITDMINNNPGIF